MTRALPDHAGQRGTTLLAAQLDAHRDSAGDDAEQSAGGKPPRQCEDEFRVGAVPESSPDETCDDEGEDAEDGVCGPAHRAECGTRLSAWAGFRTSGRSLSDQGTPFDVRAAVGCAHRARRKPDAYANHSVMEQQPGERTHIGISKRSLSATVGGCVWVGSGTECWEPGATVGP